MNPFLDVEVMPSYGSRTARISWRVADGFAGGKFIVLRSSDSVNWEPIGSGVGISYLVDDRFFPAGRLDRFFYRAILQKDRRNFESPALSALGTVTRTEFALARAIMSREWEQLRHNTPIRICKLRAHAPTCAHCGDADTGQLLAASLCLHCYGTGLEGGYLPPVDSCMQVTRIAPAVTVGRQEGAGSETPVLKDIRTLACPPLSQGDLLVEPGNDDRYLVDSVLTFWLNGRIPLLLEAKISLLPRTSVRYVFPLP